MRQGSKRAVISALLANTGIAIIKFIAGLVSGSSAMLAESYHSVSDTLNQVLLLYGLKKSKKPPDVQHPFGHGKEQFFWSFVVAILLFGIAGIFSIREGYHKLLNPEPIKNLYLNYFAIFSAFVFESYAFRIAVRNIKKEMKREQYKNFWEGVKHTKDPVNLAVFVEDLLALTGLSIAGVAITLAYFTKKIIIDAIASLIIGILLMIFASFLAYEIKNLLIGEAVSLSKRKKILKIVKSSEGIKEVLKLKTMHLGSNKVLVTLEIDYEDSLTVKEIKKLNLEIEQKIKNIIPDAEIYLEASSQNFKKKNKS
ncbi:cation diffusion facilitator family transporter [Candidatus Aminicenantes bacterium AC-335-B20]|jgi:cation diffusion facilitator family transporter|nr:cation diffusion facilitator family transporter [Candidatus Aminicenantes bacterium AC-335-B20]